MMSPLVLGLLLVAFFPVVVLAGRDAFLSREYKGHENAWNEFATLHRAAKDLGAGQVKVDGLPTLILSAISERLGKQVPPARMHRAGCVASADQVVGVSSRGTYDLLLPPDTDGTCVAPTTRESATMEWRGETQDSSVSALPPVDKVYDAVFARRTRAARMPQPNDPALNFWFLSFVNWFHDDNFRTLPDTDGSFTWSDVGGLHMAHLYGHTEYRQRALRTLVHGKMKTSTRQGWEHYPPLLVEVQADYPDFDMWTPNQGPTVNSTAAGKTETDVDLSEYFAIGDPRFNMHPGHIMWTSISLYLHNMACDLIKSEDPFFQDEDIFQRARVIVFHIIQKIRLQDFVSDSVAHTRDHVRVPYDPETLRELLTPFFSFGGGNKPNFLEFNHVYQAWHSLIPDSLSLNGEDVALKDVMWSPELFSDVPITDLATSFTDTRISRYGPHNFPPFVRGITELALSHERAQRLPTYNAYREFVGMEPLRSFDQLGVDNPDQVAQLYDGDINQLEFLTGVVADSRARLPGNFFGDVQLIVVAIFALQDLASNALLQNPVLQSAEYLTPAGLQLVKDFEFRDLLAQLTGSDSIQCPFQTPESHCIEPKEWREPDEVDSCFFKPACVCSYVGVDLVEWYYYENGYMRNSLIAFVVSMAIITVLYVCMFSALSRLCPLQEGTGLTQDNSEHTVPVNDDGSLTTASNSAKELEIERTNNKIFLHRVRLCALTINLLLSVACCPIMTYSWYTAVGDPYWFQRFGEWTYAVPNWVGGLMAAHFVAEVPLRLAQWRCGGDRRLFLQLVFHHVGFFILTAIYTVSADVAVAKIGFTILVGWTWEWTLFAPFCVVRLYDAVYATWEDGRKHNLHESRSYRRFLTYGMPTLVFMYFATRVLEAICLMMIVVCGIQRGVGTGPDAASFWTMASLTVILIGLQFHAGLMLIRMCQKRKERALQ